MNKMKKGFTVVELVVVIAVLAILVAVLIPTFSTLINKANLSKDTQLCRILNEDIAMGVEDQKLQEHATYYDVVEYLSPRYGIQNLTPTSSGDIVWDMNTNTFSLIDGGKFVYAGSSKTEANFKKNGVNLNLWKVVTSIPSAADQKFSLYLADKANVQTVNVVVGFDAGNNAGVQNVNYDRSGVQNATAQTVVIRTNGGNLTINAELDTIKHYGDLDKATIVAVANASYHENGFVPNIEVQKGRLVVEEEAQVNTVVVTGDNVKVDVPTTDENVVVKVAENVTGVDVQGTDNTSNVKVVNSLDALQNGDDVVLGQDLTTQQVISANNVTIDLNGHSIITKKISNNTNRPVVVTGTNVKLIGSGLVKSNGDGAINVNPNGSLTIEGITVESQEFAVMGFGNTNITINSGVFTTYDNFVIGTNGTVKTGDDKGHNTITINGGVFNGYIQSAGYIACGVYVANSDTVTLNGGVFNITNGCGVLCRSGNTTINNGVIFELNNDVNNPVRGKVGDSKVMVLTGATIVKDNAAHYPGGEPVVTNNSDLVVTELNSYN